MSEITKEQLDAVYTERNKCVALIAQMAIKLGHQVLVQPDWRQRGWYIIYIWLPTGQVSWHFKESEWEWFNNLPRWQGDLRSIVWDGHDTEQKYQRVLEYK